MRLPRTPGIALGWALVAAIWAASLITPPELGVNVPNQDKWGHLIAYGALMGWFCLWYTRPATRWGYLIGFALMGGVLELLQTQLPARQGSWMDLLANIASLLLGWLIVVAVTRARKQSRT